MNRDDIIRMAREAGISKPWDQEPVQWGTLERFANLVAAAERARLAQPEPEADVCCQDFRNCLRSCTPRGQWIAHVLCGCGDQIMPDDGAECGTCVTARNAVKREWQGLTDEEVKAAWSQLWYDLGNGKFAASDDPARHTTIMFAKEIEAKLKEKNT